MPLFNAVRAPTIQKFTSGSGTYTTPAGVKYIIVEMVGGGGGGTGSGTAAGTSPTSGGNSTFGTSLLTADGGSAVSFNTVGAWGGEGGAVTVNSPAIAIHSTQGGKGGPSHRSNSGNEYAIPGAGGSSPLGQGGTGASTNIGFPGTGYGSGGSGAGVTGAPAYSGAGGGSGGYIKALLASPSASYSYAVGAAGAAGAAGTTGFAGGAGAAGVIVVTEYY